MDCAATDSFRGFVLSSGSDFKIWSCEERRLLLVFVECLVVFEDEENEK